jgi:hypothetical protein
MPDHLATYLNDHLSGSTAALELLEQPKKRRAMWVAYLLPT